MGTSIDDWANVAGAYYTGAGSSEMFWLIVSAALCVIALVVGAKHELDAYAKAEK